MKIVVENTDTKEIKTFTSEDGFIEYAQKTYEEREASSIVLFGPSTIHWLPDNLYNASEYIEEYCSELILTVY